jgi:hypothetical protein
MDETLIRLKVLTQTEKEGTCSNHTDKRSQDMRKFIFVLIDEIKKKKKEKTYDTNG